MDFDENNDNHLEQLEESQYKKRHPAYKILAVILLLAFISLSIPQITLLLSGKLDFLQNSVNPQDNPDLKRASAAVVSIKSYNEDLLKYRSVQGTGFNISPQGLILSNQHIVENAKSVKIDFQDGIVSYSDDIHVFANADIVWLNIDAQGLPCIGMQIDTIPAAGDIVSVIGNPLGYEKVILQGPIRGYYKIDNIPIMILDIDCKPGNSGSPVINEQGQAVGIVFAVTARSEDKTGINLTLAYPLYYFKDYFKEFAYPVIDP